MSDLSPLFQHPPSPISQLSAPYLTTAGVELWVKRDDLLRMGPGLALCGNKWRKLQYNLQAAREQGQQRLLTYGGAFSNHLAAVAAAGAAFGFQTVGIVRGEASAALNPTLRFASSCGMRLQFVSRAQFRERQAADFQAMLQANYAPFYELPEGGTNALAIKGCENLAQEIAEQFAVLPDYCCTSVGTGGTLAGLISGLNGRSYALGFSALKGDFLEGDVHSLLQDRQCGHLDRWSIRNEFHFGGYAKHSAELLDFINAFYQKHGIALDPVYTGKMMYGLQSLIQAGHFPSGSRLLAVHTGGLQGVLGFNERFGQQLLLGLG